MKVHFWGTRGSLPAPLSAETLQKKMAAVLCLAGGRKFADSSAALSWLAREVPFPLANTFGGNTPCIEIMPDQEDESRHEYLLCDLGSGARNFSLAALGNPRRREPQTFHILMSHVHWDHIMGFPFFTQAYIPGNKIVIYGGHENLEEAFRRQHAAPSFPVDYSKLLASIEYVRLVPERTYLIAGFSVTVTRQVHAGDSYGYRIERDGQSVIYTTDSEHPLDDHAEWERCIEFFRNADLVIFDAMYTLAAAATIKREWGHSSNVVGVEMCQMAKAKHLVLFHHDPALDDDALAVMLAETRRFESITRGDHPLEISSAYDGLEIACSVVENARVPQQQKLA